VGGISVWHWLIVIVIYAIWIIPLYRICGRIGWAPAWALVALIPFLGVVLVWAIAFGRWSPSEATETVSNSPRGEGPRFNH